MLKKIREYFSRRRAILGLLEETAKLNAQITELKAKLEESEKKIGNPIEVVKKITDDQFRWYDYNELPADSLKIYHDQAQSILRMDVFKNEISRLNTEWAKFAANQSPNFEGVLAMRHQMSGINLLQERLEKIPDPTKEPKPHVENPYAGI